MTDNKVVKSHKHAECIKQTPFRVVTQTRPWAKYDVTLLRYNQTSPIHFPPMCGSCGSGGHRSLSLCTVSETPTRGFCGSVAQHAAQRHLLGPGRPRPREAAQDVTFFATHLRVEGDVLPTSATNASEFSKLVVHIAAIVNSSVVTDYRRYHGGRLPPLFRPVVFFNPRRTAS